jgi:hypothetical protein
MAKHRLESDPLLAHGLSVIVYAALENFSA